MAAPPPNKSLATRVSLTFSCEGLLDKDLTSKSDPIVQVMSFNSQNNWREVKFFTIDYICVAFSVY